MKNFIKYTLVVIIIAALVAVATHFMKDEYAKNTNEDLKTEMLQVQAKVRLEFEKFHVNKENGLKGEKIENSEYGIEEDGEFYKWTREILEDEGIIQSKLKEDEFYIVNYNTEEVIFISNDGKFKLSEMEKGEKANDTEKADDRQGETKTE